MSATVSSTVVKIFGILLAVVIIVLMVGHLSEVSLFGAAGSLALGSVQSGLNSTLHIIALLIVGAVALIALGSVRRG